MTNVLHLPIADSNLSGDGLRPATGTGQPETENAVPESILWPPDAIVVSAWPRNNRETLMVRLDSYKSHPVVDARTWYAGADGELKPGRGGLTVSIKHLPQLADALSKALAEATKRGLICREGGGS